MTIQSSFKDIMPTSKIDQAFSADVAKKYKQVEKEASKVIGSFANLVEELIKLKELSSGTSAKDPITKLAGELNNSSVFFARMIGDELGKIHNIVNPDTSGQESTKSTV